jgi:hypothetical protein
MACLILSTILFIVFSFDQQVYIFGLQFSNDPITINTCKYCNVHKVSIIKPTFVGMFIIWYLHSLSNYGNVLFVRFINLPRAISESSVSSQCFHYILDTKGIKIILGIMFL